MLTLSPAAKKKVLRLIVWTVFSVLFALLPVLANYIIRGRLAPGHESAGEAGAVWEIVREGELLVIAAAIASDAVGRVFLATQRSKLSRVIFCISSFMLLAVRSMSF